MISRFAFLLNEVRYPEFIFCLKGTSQSMRKAVQNRFIFPVFVSFACLLMQSCDPLRDVRVDFTILQRPGQIFSFYKSFYALFNDHRARQEPRFQLLGHLTGHNQTIVRNLQIPFLEQINITQRTHAHLCNQYVVLHPLPGLHDAYNSSLDFMFPVIIYFLPRLLALRVRLALLSSNCRRRIQRVCKALFYI